MRIAYLSQARVPSDDASSIQVMQMCEGFALQGAAVTLHAQPGPADLGGRDVFRFYGVAEAFEIVLHRFPRIPRIGLVLFSRRAARAAGRGTAPDLVYGRHVDSLVAAQRWGRPTVYEVHAPPGGHRAAMERRLFASPHFAALVAISQSLAGWYRDHVPALGSRPVLVEPDCAAVAGVEREQSDGARPTRVGYVGRFYEGRGIDVVVALARRLPDVDFHVVGGTAADLPPGVDGGLPPNLTFHGSLPHADVPGVMQGFDIALAPYQRRVGTRGGADTARWMSPLKIFEYLANGCALVASDLPVLREVLTHGTTALLCDPADLDAWEAAVRSLASDPALRERLARNGRALISDRFTWSARAGRVLDRVGHSLGAHDG